MEYTRFWVFFFLPKNVIRSGVNLKLVAKFQVFCYTIKCTTLLRLQKSSLGTCTSLLGTSSSLKYFKAHRVSRWTIRHGLVLLWFTDLMNVTEKVTIHRPNVSKLLFSAFILFRLRGIFSPNLRILSRKNNEPTRFILFLAMTVTTNTSDGPNVSLVHVRKSIKKRFSFAKKKTQLYRCTHT